MSDSDSFGENPFRSLNMGKLPEKKAGKPAESRTAAKNRKHIKTRPRPTENDSSFADPGIDAEERDLFLRSIGQMQASKAPRGANGARKQSGPGTFLLEEHASLPHCHDLKKKHNKGKAGMPTLRSERGAGGEPRRDGATPTQRESQPDAVQGGLRMGAKNPSASDATQRTPHAASHAADMADPDADDAVFLQAMGEVAPLQGRGRDVAPVPDATTPPPNGEISLQDFMDGKLEFALSFSDEYLEGHVVGLDQMTINKLRAGSFSPEAHLDLHGLNALQAFEALRGFLRGGWYKGLRTVLVVPGRGRNSPDGIGILREKLQNWLTQDPFKRVVLAFCTAQPHDGGPGSVYVLLRKYKKKGRVYWERTPADDDLY